MDKPVETDLSDAELLARYRNGDLESFARFYRRHSRGLFFYVHSLSRDPVQSEDVVQEAFARLLDHELSSLRETLKSYLYTTARNVLFDEARKARVREAKPPMLRPRDGVPPELAESVSHALGKLPGDQREIVVLKIYSELTFSEIAEMTRLPEGTVMSRYRYAVDKLASILREEHDEV